ncbi:VOC family protein [Armatimonas sp.]|uniref:VOC family protein n=1 Tax=Armatimonas sp. TaxID=1872638 RepID=UPI00375106F6
MPVERIVPNVTTTDLNATREFYCDILGLTAEVQMDDFMMLSSPADPSVQITVNDHAFPGLPPGFGVDVGTPEEQKRVYDAVVKRGLPIVEPLADMPWGIRRFSVIDPSGVRVTVVVRIEALPSE